MNKFRNSKFWVYALSLVLIVGCCTPSQVYSRERCRFVPAGQLNDARNDHTATLLNDGRILIVGGHGRRGDKPLSSAEIYDPKTRTFTLTGSMTYPRRGHAAVKLKNGKVLIMGGEMPYKGISSYLVKPFELYDPITGHFSVYGGLPSDFNYSLPDFQLLPNDQVLMTTRSAIQWSKRPEGNYNSDIYLYDVEKQTFQPVGVHQRERSDPSVIVSDDGNEILYLGGGMYRPNEESKHRYPYLGVHYTWQEYPMEDFGCEVINIRNPLKNRFIPCQTGASFEALKLRDGRVFYPVYISGALINQEFTESKKIKVSNIWREPRKHQYTLTELSNGSVLIVGGIYEGEQHFRLTKSYSSEVYDLKTETVRKIKGPRNKRLYGHTATQLNDGSVLIVGGVNDDRKNWKNFGRVGDSELYQCKAKK